jgi:His-Xaa-Ser system radical SAM maturase HxsB
VLTQLQYGDTRSQAFFRFRELPNQQIVLTNREGNFLVLPKEDFRQFADGTVEPGSTLHAKLKDRNFFRDGFDQTKAVQQQQKRTKFLGTGPNLHILVVTLRCNETCVYCHSSRATMEADDSDMTMEVAEKSVEMILQSTSPSVTIEFQGGEPLVNFPVVKHIIEYALERNRAVRKTIEFTLVSNLALMDEEKLKFLLEHRVQICTSIDGPAHLHDKQRKLPNASAHGKATYWIKRINEAYVEQGLEPNVYHVEALLTTTRETLPLWKEVVDTYVALGCRALFLRPLDPFGFAEKTSGRVEYPRREFLEFYANAVNYMIELNKQGVQILERFAGIFLTKILGGEDPNYLDIRSPCGAGIGQIAYNYDGSIYTCDEGRMLREMGDESFLIGHVQDSRYREIIGHETVRAIALASVLDGQPDCTSCAYNPYCGVCPVHNHKTQGHLWGRMRESTLCSVHKGIQDYLFSQIATNDPATMATFKQWTTVRDRSHFLQTCAT